MCHVSNEWANFVEQISDQYCGSHELEENCSA